MAAISVVVAAATVVVVVTVIAVAISIVVTIPVAIPVVVAGAVVEEVDFEQIEYSLKVSRVDEGAFEVVFEEMSSLNQNLTQVACN